MNEKKNMNMNKNMMKNKSQERNRMMNKSQNNSTQKCKGTRCGSTRVNGGW